MMPRVLVALACVALAVPAVGQGSPATAREVAEAAGGPLRVTLIAGDACGDVPCAFPEDAILHLQPLDEDAAAERREPVEGWGEVLLPVDPGPGWRLEIDAEGYWAPPRVVPPGTGVAGLTLHPVTHLRVRSAPAAGRAAPGDLRAAFSPAPRGTLAPASRATAGAGTGGLHGEVACIPEGPGSWTCPVPSGRVDLRLHARGFASVHLWDLSLAPFATVELPAVELVPGSSLVGWLTTAEGGPPPDDARVRAVPVDASPTAPQARQRTRSATVGERGLFQFRDLPAGSYRLRAELPGWAPFESPPIEVLPGLEARLQQPLHLQRPARLRVCVDPPDPPGPRRPGDGWVVTVTPLPGTLSGAPPARGPVDPQGCRLETDLRPGRHRLRLHDERRSLWRDLEVDLEPGDRHVELRLDLVPIHGTLTRDGRPVRARLQLNLLGDRDDGRPRIGQVVLYTDPEGRFEGALPEPGTWQVQAAFSAEGALRELAIVELEAGSRSREIDLRVPDTRLSGTVVDSAGRPVSGARVGVDRLDPPAGDAVPPEAGRQYTDGEARFDFDGLRPGRYEVFALQGSRTARAEVEVVDGAPSLPLTLVLDAVRQLRGSLQGDGGGVPGAQVLAFPEVPGGARRTVRQVTTGPDGSFRLAVPEAATALRIVILAHGYGARVLRIPLPSVLDGGPGEPPLVLTVDRLAGTLHLSGEDPAAVTDRTRLLVDGVPVSLRLLREWALTLGGRAEPGTWTLPSMGIGEYRACDPSGERCDGGFLGAGEVLELAPG